MESRLPQDQFLEGRRESTQSTTVLEIRKSQDLAREFGGTASKTEKKFVKQKL